MTESFHRGGGGAGAGRRTGRYRAPLRALNGARVVAVTTLLLASFVIELLFRPERPLTPLYAIAAAVYATVLVYALLERWLGDRPGLAVAQLAADVAIVAAFVEASGGCLSPVSFLFVVPVMTGAVMFGLTGGTLTALGSWGVYALILGFDAWRGAGGGALAGQMLYAAVSHLVGFVALGALGGALSDRARAARQQLDVQRSDLDALRALHAQIVASISSGIVTANPAGRITFVNRAGTDILRQPEEALRGSSLTELFELPDEVLAEVERMPDEPQRARFERTWRRPADGEELLIGYVITPMRDEESDGRGWLLVFQDLTQIASLEQRVRTRERMAALGEMAAGMAHELRNPLAAISGCVQVLAEGAGGEPQPELVDVTLRETERLNRIIRDFLDFARPGPFRPQPCNLTETMDNLSRLLRKSPELRDGHEVVVLSPGGDRWAVADADRMRQVFWNLASNALKAMPDGGRLTVELSGHGGDQVQVAFRDEGQGMDEEAVGRYFQPFSGGFRGGAGLGAAVVYRIAEEHGGHVQVLSRPGRGTEIRLILPRAEVDAERRDVELAVVS
jgi:two-component system sensor histidine kinase PilS (NtrC family)